MGYWGIQAVWLGLTLGVLGTSAATVEAQSANKNQPAPNAIKDLQSSHSAALAIPLDRLPPKVGEGGRCLLALPTLAAHGPAEVFRARSFFYCWLLDHPDLAVQMWRRLGARCVTISDRGDGRFGWADGQGTDISWQTIHRARGIQ